MSKDAINFATRNTLPVMERRPMTVRAAAAAFQHVALQASLRDPGHSSGTR